MRWNVTSECFVGLYDARGLIIGYLIDKFASLVWYNLRRSSKPAICFVEPLGHAPCPLIRERNCLYKLAVVVCVDQQVSISFCWFLSRVNHINLNDIPNFRRNHIYWIRSRFGSCWMTWKDVMLWSFRLSVTLVTVFDLQKIIKISAVLGSPVLELAMLWVGRVCVCSI